MATSFRELKRELLQVAGSQLAEFGFSPRVREQSFRRKCEGGRVSVHLAFINHVEDFDVTVDVAIRFDAVEQIVNRSNSMLSAREKLDTYTLGAELGNIERGEPRRLTVAPGVEIGGVARTIIQMLKTTGFPYLDKFCQAEAAYQMLAEDGREAWLHCPFHSSRAMRACALLVVLGREGELPTLIERKLGFLRSVNDPCVSNFQRFADTLPSLGSQ